MPRWKKVLHHKLSALASIRKFVNLMDNKVQKKNLKVGCYKKLISQQESDGYSPTMLKRYSKLI